MRAQWVGVHGTVHGTVHGILLLLASAVRGREHLPEVYQGGGMAEQRCVATRLSILTVCFHLQAYLYNDDDFNWNYGLSLASVGDFKVLFARERFPSLRSRGLTHRYACSGSGGHAVACAE